MQYREISIDNLEVIGKGVTATVYLLDMDNVVKVFSKNVPIEKIQYEYDCAALVYDLGIKTPKVYEIIKSGDNYGIIYERMKGMIFSEYIIKNLENAYEMGIEYGHIVKGINSSKVVDKKLPKANEFMKKLYSGNNKWVSKDEAKLLDSIIDMVPINNSLLHGDIAPVNIMLNDNIFYLIDVTTIMCGNTLFDLLQPYTFCKITSKFYETYLNMPEEKKNSPLAFFLKRFESRYLEADVAEKLWNGFLDGYFGKDNYLKENIDFIMKIYNSVKLMGACALSGTLPDEVIEYMTEYGRNIIMNNKDNLQRMDFTVFSN